jgi:protease I
MKNSQKVSMKSTGKAVMQELVAEPLLKTDPIIDEDLVTGMIKQIEIEDIKITSPDEKLDYGGHKLRVAILSEDGFEEIELTSPKKALEDAGITVDIVSPHTGHIKGWKEKDWGKEVVVDKDLQTANAEDYDALVLPGGVMNPDKLRLNKEAVFFVSQFIRTGKTVAAICHGPQTLIETGMIEGKTMTSYPSLETDLRNAGVNWVDEEMVHYGQFITSRKPADLKAFNSELLDTLAIRRA